MKTPQLEDGFTRITNPVLDAWIKSPDIPAPRRCQMYIARRSWGFQKATADLRPKDFVKACNIPHKNIHRVLKQGIDRGLFYTLNVEGISGVRYKINKKYSDWKIPSTKRLPSTLRVNTLNTEGKHIYKENIKEKEINSPDSDLRKKGSKEEWAYKINVEMPKGFYLTDRMRRYAASKEITSEKHDGLFERFVTHHMARNNKFANWSRAWHTWVQNEIKFNQKEEKEDAFTRVRRKLEKANGPSGVGGVSEQTAER